MNYSEFYLRILTGCGIGLLFGGLFFYAPPALFSVLLLAIAMLIIIIELPKLAPNPFVWIILTLGYILIPILLLCALNNNPLTHSLVLLLFGLVFFHDVGAYCVGKILGTHRILPAISPKKSWEGFIGGLCSTLVGFYSITPLLCTQSFSLLTAFLFSCCVAVIATAGDFFESWLKRRARLKDSSNLLPGHGGLLDRFDSIIFVVLFFYSIQDYLLIWCIP